MTSGRAIVAEVRSRARITWARGGSRRRALVGVGLLAAAVLAGAFLLGAWHVLFGGLVKGNWRAGGFGIALATIAGALLVVEAAVVLRLSPPADHRA